MGVLTLCGSLLLAFAPAMIMLKLVIAKRSHLVIVSITSAFAWLVSILLASAIFVLFDMIDGYPPVISLIVGAIIQEIGRVVYIIMYSRTEIYIQNMAQIPYLPFTDFGSAIAAGYGMGVMYALVMYGGVLQASLSDADYFAPQCFQVSVFALSSFSALLFQILHVCISIIMFDAMRKIPGKVHYPRVIAAGTLHVAASCMTFLNSAVGCEVGTPLLVFVVIVAAFHTYTTAKSSDYYGGAMFTAKAT